MRGMALKLSRYFYLLMEKPRGRYFQGSVSLLSGGTLQPENTYSCIFKVTGQVRKPKKDKHQHYMQECKNSLT